jgi:hypothetical protein
MPPSAARLQGPMGYLSSRSNRPASRPCSNTRHRIVAADIRIAVAQITVVIAAGRLTLLRRKRLGMHSFAMLGSGTRRILVSTACLCGSRHSLATRREPGWGIPAEASDEERMLLYRLDSEVVNLPHIADARDESAKLAERDSLLGIDYCCEGAAICGVQTERSLEVAIVGRHVCIRGVWCRRSSLGTRDYSNSGSLIR